MLMKFMIFRLSAEHRRRRTKLNPMLNSLDIAASNMDGANFEAARSQVAN